MIQHIISQTLSGKTVNRMLMNHALRAFALSGDVLDLGAGTKRSSYLSFFRGAERAHITSLDISPDRAPDILADLEQSLPLRDGSYDAVLCFNLLEHIYGHAQLAREMRRVLRPDGVLYGYVPFLVKVHPDPNDYFRYAAQGLERVLKDAGFSRVELAHIGAGPLTAAWAQCEFVLPRFLRWPITLGTLVCDRAILAFKPIFRGAFPLGYVFIARP